MSKLYRLEQWYPTLPESFKDRGHVLVKREYNPDRYSIQIEGESGTLPVDEIENNPEFWKLWGRSEYSIHEIIPTSKNRMYPDKPTKTNKELFELVDNEYWNIYSVKIHSNNKIITLDDKVREKMALNKSYVSIDKMWARETNLQIMAVLQDGSHIDVNHLGVKDSFFKTNDGQTITNPNRAVYRIDRKNTSYDIVTANDILESSPYRPNEKIFYEEENAKHYIEENKPRYSRKQVKDLLDNLPTPWIGKILKGLEDFSN